MTPDERLDVVRDELAAVIRFAYLASFDWRVTDPEQCKRGRPRKSKGMTLDRACEMVALYFAARANQWDDEGTAELLALYGKTDEMRRKIARAMLGAGRRGMPMNVKDARRAYLKYHGANPPEVQHANAVELERQHMALAREFFRVASESESGPRLH